MTILLKCAIIIRLGSFPGRLTKRTFPTEVNKPMSKSRTLRFIIPIILTVVTFGFADSAHASDQPVCYGVSNHSPQTIRSVQSALGVYVDGYFGPRSCTALIAFQRAHNPPLRDYAGNFGRLCPNTLTALGATAQATATSSVRATGGVPANSGTGKRVIVDQRTNQVNLVDASGNLVGSGGMVDNPSKLPKVIYWIGYKNKSGIDDNSNTLWLPNYMQFSGDIGFHKIPVRKSTGNPIHGESLLGTSQGVSAGCIRLGYDFSDQLWSFAPVGTKVVVI